MSISIADSASSLKAESRGNVEFYSIALPYEAIGYDPSAHSLLGALSIQSPVGQLVDTAVTTIFEQLRHASHEESALMASALAGLLRGLTLGEQNSEVTVAVQKCRNRAIKRYVLKHLRNPDLSVELVCRSLSISRATLYRVFKSEGGFRHFVTKRRLTGAMRQLKRSQPYRGLIGDIAACWCFDDPSEFSKQFKRRFGIAPSEVYQCSSSINLAQLDILSDGLVTLH